MKYHQHALLDGIRTVGLRGALSAGDLDLSKRDDKGFILEVLIHSADIANPCRPARVYKLWTDRVMAEFYSQGDREKQEGLPVSKFFDRDAPNVPRCQIGAEIESGLE